MKRPALSLNLAISADGRISGPQRQSSGWTSRDDHQRLLDLRNAADALLVGRGTLDADRMTLTAPGAAREPLRCIVSRSGRLDPGHPVFHTPGGPLHLLVTGEHPVPAPPSCITLHRGDLSTFLEKLARDHNVRRVHCEGGGELARSLAAADLIDTLHLTWAGHTLFGGSKSPGVTGPPGDFLPASLRFDLVHFEPRADLGECFLTWRRAR